VKRILLVEDHTAFREAMATYLERDSDFEVAAQAGSLAEARAIASAEFDVAVTTPNNARELAEKVREVICEEWQGAGGSLYSAVIYERLSEEGVEVPGYQMSAVLNAFKVGNLITERLRFAPSVRRRSVSTGTS
jgi:DNA-binding NarL/FixJ family response regulator